ncbi:A/G-specific adenine glycosylase [Desulfonema ishimotonii]|uniref:Adenine DNA glycosylase n=1 Tax=Desulfonema ishimotonii TaxID=45657 RepID=A0A401FTG9_9BACT|nr:A/G-specific adenine glycosylase [Desulfonema ishimotonii]GBC60253.1 A/G-specific adenine glycosylase [Desulfonema ishimotonii]
MKLKNTASIRKHLVRWYMKHHRALPWRETRDPYRIWVSEVMLQQTQVNTVIPYYERFLKRFPDVNALAEADAGDVLKLWEGLGYYARCRNLHKAAGQVVAAHGGKIPDERTRFKKLPGVGDYIASAVQSIAFSHAHAVVDGNVKRVLARIFRMDAPVNQPASYPQFRDIAATLLDTARPGIFNQAVMELGALICKPKTPDCGNCPVSDHCGAYAAGVTDEYPKRVRRKPVPVRHMVAGIVHKEGRMLITQRKAEGLLGGLWEFPGGEVRKGETAEAACIREITEQTGLSVGIVSPLTRVRHAYTHFKIEMDVFHCRYLAGDMRLSGPDDFRWITPDETDDYPFPKANHKFIRLLTSDKGVSG